MLKRFIPFAHAKTIYDIDINFFKKLNVKYIFADLDNTLDSYKQKSPLAQAKKFKTELEKTGIELIIISNNTGKRVKKYSEELGVKYFSSLRKPFTHKLLKMMSENKIDNDFVIMIGDQIVTDISCANKAKIKSVLTEKLVKEDQPTTKINRILDNHLRRRLNKKNLLKDWRQI